MSPAGNDAPVPPPPPLPGELGGLCQSTFLLSSSQQECPDTPTPGLTATVGAFPPTTDDRASNPPPPDELQGILTTSMTLLSHPDTPGHGDNNKFTLIQPTAGHWMRPLCAAIPLKVIASPVYTWNTFSLLASDDALSTASALSGDTDTTPSL